MVNRPPAYQGRPHKPRKARVKVDLWCEILGPRDRAVGHIRNLTVGGCRILSPSAFPLRETVSLVLSEEPELRLRAQLRWLALNPAEGPFELGVQFVHEGDSERRIEGMLKAAVRRTSRPEPPPRPSYAKFGGPLDPAQRPGTPGVQESRRSYAARGLARWVKPDPSAPLP